MEELITIYQKTFILVNRSIVKCFFKELLNYYEFHEIRMIATVSFRRRYCGITFFLLFCCFIVYNQRQNSYLQNYGPVVGWEYNRSRNAFDYVLPDDITSLIPGNSICSNKNPPRVLLIVCSSTENFVLRNAIRKTWAYLSHKKFNITVAFLMGVSVNKEINKSIQEESQIFNDIIVENFVDTYNNLTIKTLMLLKWVKNNCMKATYIMKTDDDVYINIKNLAQFLDSNPNNNSDILYGQLICSSEPVLDSNNKWFMPSYLYSNKVYPNYVAGYGYLMSLNVALRLYEEAFNVPIIHMEDVFITGICAQQAGIKPIEPFMFHRKQMVNIECSPYDNNRIIYDHKVTEEDMFIIHDMLQNCIPTKSKRTFFDWLFRRKKNPKIGLFAKINYYCDI